jgi:hypothetical protein
MEDQTKAHLEHALKWGLILGMTNIVIYLLGYIVDKTMITHWWYGLISLAINITLMVVPVVSKRKELGGVISLRDAFLICFVVIAGGSLLQSIFNYILYNLIDPGLSDFIKQKTIENMTSMMERFGAPQESIDKALENIQNTDFSQTPARIGKQYFFMVLFGGFIALIVAAILKRKQKTTDFE